MIGGVSGSGKTTLAASLLSTGDLPAVSVSADDYMIDKRGFYHFDSSRLELVHSQCLERVATLMREASASRIFVHNTFLSQREWQPYLELAERYGWRAHVLMVMNHHSGKNTHDVPDPVREQQRSRLKRLVNEVRC